MNRREGNDMEKVLKRRLDFAKARMEARHRELEDALCDTTMPEEYRRGLVRYAEAGLEAAIVEVRFAMESFDAFTTRSNIPVGTQEPAHR